MDARSDTEADAMPDAGRALNWAESLGSTETFAEALDPTNGDIALSGSGTLGGRLSPGGAFLARFDSAGANKWAHAFPSGGVVARSVAVDGSGNVLVEGAFHGTADFGGGPVPLAGPYEDMFLAEYDSVGGLRWLQHSSAVAMMPQDNPQAPATIPPAWFDEVVFDGAGNIYCVGSLNGSSIDLGCGATPSGAGEFVAELDPTGACIWSQAYGASDSFQGYVLNIALDPTGRVLVAGGFVGTVDFGAGPLSDPYVSNESTAVFVQKLGSDGAVLWTNSFGPGVVTGLAADASGDILLAGYSSLGESTSFNTFFVQNPEANPSGPRPSRARP